MSKFLTGFLIGVVSALTTESLLLNKTECREKSKKILNKTADVFEHTAHKI